MKISTVVFAAFVGSAAAFAPATQTSRLDTSLFGRKAFITGNWKLNPATRDEAVSLATGIASSVSPDSPGDVALFVPYPYLESVYKAVDGKILVGAEVRKVVQNVNILFTFTCCVQLICYVSLSPLRMAGPSLEVSLRP